MTCTVSIRIIHPCRAGVSESHLAYSAKNYAVQDARPQKIEPKHEAQGVISPSDGVFDGTTQVSYDSRRSIRDPLQSGGGYGLHQHLRPLTSTLPFVSHSTTQSRSFAVCLFLVSTSWMQYKVDFPRHDAAATAAAVNIKAARGNKGGWSSAVSRFRCEYDV